MQFSTHCKQLWNHESWQKTKTRDLRAPQGLGLSSSEFIFPFSFFYPCLGVHIIGFTSAGRAIVQCKKALLSHEFKELCIGIFLFYFILVWSVQVHIFSPWSRNRCYQYMDIDGSAITTHCVGEFGPSESFLPPGLPLGSLDCPSGSSEEKKPIGLKLHKK